MRQNTAAVQTGDSDCVVIQHDLGDFTCVITGQILFDPVVTHCGQHIERAVSANNLPRCPCCNTPGHNKFNEASAFFKTTLQKTIQQYRLYEDVYFDLESFKQIVSRNQLNTPLGERFLTLLQNATSHLNTKELIRTETQVTHPAYLEIPQVTVVETQGKSPIEILAETRSGRDLLRKKLKIVPTSAASAGSEKYFFGNAEISTESLQTQVNGKSIRAWLSMTTEMEKFEINATESMLAVEKEVEAIRVNKERLFHQARLFLLRGARGAAATGDRIQSNEVNPILQLVVYGEENKVKEALEAVKSNSTQLSALLSDTGTVKDYSNRTITSMTLLQAAAAAGDVDMCLMLKDYMSPEEFATQLTEIFRERIENTFNFDAILAAIRAANIRDLDAALNKTNNGSPICLALEEFRHQFSELSNNEKIFNPQHLLRAFEVYNALWDQCERDGSDRDYKKRDLFWRQIIGYTQRFMPACYAQAFSQGLYYLVKVDQPDSWRPEAFKRDLKLRCDNFSYFPLPRDSRSGLGFDFAIYGRHGFGRFRATGAGDLHFFQKLLSSKNSWLSEHYAASAEHITQPV